MNCKQLGEHFDIHGGGSDLMFHTTKMKSPNLAVLTEANMELLDPFWHDHGR